MKNLDLSSEDKATLPLKISRILREAIFRGDLVRGQRLVQDELANALGVSRMPVREALRRLEAEGLVIIEPYRKAVVVGIEIEDVQEIYELRALLESKAVELSAGRMNEKDVAELESLVEEMKNAVRKQEFDRFIELNVKFHKHLVKYCTWRRLLSFIEMLWNGFPQQTPHILPNQMEMSELEHEAILRAIKANDAAEAARLVQNHIRRTGEHLIQKMRRDRASSSAENKTHGPAH